MRIGRRQLLGVAATAGPGLSLAGCLGAVPERDHLATGDRVLSVAHRGSMYLWPENTLPAIEYAFETGADIVEFDLDTTADGTIVSIHDATVDRTTDGSGAINELTDEEVAELDAGYHFPPDEVDPAYLECGVDHDEVPGHDGATDPEHPFRGRGIEIPTLEEVLDRVDRTDVLLLDVKRERPDPERIVELLETYNRIETTLIGAFETTYLQAIRSIEPNLETATSLDEGRQVIMSTNANEHRFDPAADFFWALHENVRSALVRRAHRNAMSVMPWTVNDPAEMERLIEIDVDSLITDDHLLLNSLR